MNPEAVKKAFDICDAAFQRYIQQATKTHKMLSELSGNVSIEQRFAINTQRIAENEAQLLYATARDALFEVLRVETQWAAAGTRITINR